MARHLDSGPSDSRGHDVPSNLDKPNGNPFTSGGPPTLKRWPGTSIVQLSWIFCSTLFCMKSGLSDQLPGLSHPGYRGEIQLPSRWESQIYGQLLRWSTTQLLFSPACAGAKHVRPNFEFHFASVFSSTTPSPQISVVGFPEILLIALTEQAQLM